MGRTRRLLATLLPLLTTAVPSAGDVVCRSDADSAVAERCYGAETCGDGVCAPAFTLDRFPLESVAADAYAADLIGVLDHSGDFFYTQCCDTRITAYTGESVDRGPGALCPAPPDFPACFLQLCTCVYPDPEGDPFVINGHYVAGDLLFYDGHAGYDYRYGFGTPIFAPKAGLLCKAVEDPINGRVGVGNAWDKFHTFHIDHGLFDGVGWSTWYLHAADLQGQDTSGAELRDLTAAPPAASSTPCSSASTSSTSASQIPRFPMRTPTARPTPPIAVAIHRPAQRSTTPAVPRISSGRQSPSAASGTSFAASPRTGATMTR